MKAILIAVFVYILVVAGAVFGDEPTTIKRVRGKAGVAERVESKGKAAKEAVVRVRVSRIIDGVVVQDRIVVKGADVFDAKPVKERKERVKERPQPKSKQPEKEIKVKARVGR